MARTFFSLTRADALTALGLASAGEIASDGPAGDHAQVPGDPPVAVPVVSGVHANEIREYRDRLDAACHMVAQATPGSIGLLGWLYVGGAAKRRRKWAQVTLVLGSTAVALLQVSSIVRGSILWPLHFFLGLLHANVIYACVHNRPREGEWEPAAPTDA